MTDEARVDDDIYADTGTLTLDSGRWNWAATQDMGGWRIHFRHHSRLRDEMLSSVGATVLEQADVEEAGRNPHYRFWQDDDGKLWRLSLEIDAQPYRSRSLVRGGMMIVFRTDGMRMEVPVSGELPIGELTDPQIVALFKD